MIAADLHCAGHLDYNPKPTLIEKFRVQPGAASRLLGAVFPRTRRFLGQPERVPSYRSFV